MRLPPTARTTRSTLGAIAAAALLLGGASTASAGVGAQPARTATTAKAAAYTATPADVRMKAALASRATTARFGTMFSGSVIDAASNAYVWGKNSNSYRLPASTNKLVTATNALTVFGPDKRWTTQVRAGSRAEHVILVGAGDPSLSSTSLEAMARTTAAALLAQKITAAKVYVDDDVFPTPTLAYGWKASYVPDSIAPVRGLVRDQRNTTDTSADAGGYFRDRLKAHGVTGAVYSGRANAASGARVIASSTGSTLSSIVQSMLLYSDNEVAEALHKLVGRQLGLGATWAGARTAQAEELAAQRPAERQPLRRVGPVSRRPDHHLAAGVDPRPRRPPRHPGHPLGAQGRAAHRGPNRHARQPLHDGRLEVRRGPGARQDRHIERRRLPRRLDHRRRRPGQGLRVPGQRQDVLHDAAAERRHAGRHGHRLLLTSAPRA